MSFTLSAICPLRSTVRSSLDHCLVRSDVQSDAQHEPVGRFHAPPKSELAGETRYKFSRRLSISDHQLRRQDIHTQRISHEIPRLGLLHP